MTVLFSSFVCSAGYKLFRRSVKYVLNAQNIYFKCNNLNKRNAREWGIEWFKMSNFRFVVFKYLFLPRFILSLIFLPMFYVEIHLVFRYHTLFLCEHVPNFSFLYLYVILKLKKIWKKIFSWYHYSCQGPSLTKSEYRCQSRKVRNIAEQIYLLTNKHPNESQKNQESLDNAMKVRQENPNNETKAK